MTDYGYIKISRKMFDGSDRLWEENRPRTKAEAWIDLIQMANWRTGQRIIGCEIVELNRGEFLASYRYLANRWRWSKNKVNTFLKLLQKSGRIKGQRQTTFGYVYVLINYRAYQDYKDSDRDGKGTA